jgi:hypothetical protein
MLKLQQFELRRREKKKRAARLFGISLEWLNGADNDGKEPMRFLFILVWWA